MPEGRKVAFFLILDPQRPTTVNCQIKTAIFAAVRRAELRMTLNRNLNSGQGFAVTRPGDATNNRRTDRMDCAFRDADLRRRFTQIEMLGRSSDGNWSDRWFGLFHGQFPGVAGSLFGAPSPLV